MEASIGTLARNAVSGDVPFNPYRVPATESARKVVDDVITNLTSYEKFNKTRVRARRPNDEQLFRATVTAIVCDLIYFETSGVGGNGVYVSRSNNELGRKSRYRAPILTPNFAVVLDLMSTREMDFVVQTKGVRMGFLVPAARTVIRAGGRLLSRIDEWSLGPDDLTTEGGGEVIQLGGEKELDDHGQPKSARLCEYDDDATTNRYRDEMQRINAWVKKANISLVDGRPIGSRHLHRKFTNGSFESGGRLYGGFWQNLSKEDERPLLRINGECCAVADFSQFNAALAYAVVGGGKMPLGDAYSLPGLEPYRRTAKVIFNAMMFSERPPKRFPRGLRAEHDLPPAVTVAQFVDAIEAKHPRLKTLFCSGAGHWLQFMESQILIQALLDLQSEEVVALPIHDAVIVQLSAVEKAMAAMKEAFRSLTGDSIQVHFETL